jgi:hypothetical protein
MPFYEMRSVSKAIITYAVYGALCFFVGMYKGCDAGFDHGYRQAIYDIHQQEPSRLEFLIKKEEERK